MTGWPQFWLGFIIGALFWRAAVSCWEAICDMPDITMCRGDECPLRRECYRYRANPGYMQSFFTEAPIDLKTGKCEYFLEYYGKYFGNPDDSPADDSWRKK